MGKWDCFSCVKYLMFAFNFVFWLLGCAVLGVGIWIRADPQFREYVDSAGEFNYLYTGAYIFIVIGVIIMLVGFLGCFGALRENQGMLISFFTALLIIFICLLAAGIWAVLARHSLKRTVTDTLRTAVRDYEKDTQARVFLDSIMTRFSCCGANAGAPDFMLYGHPEIPKRCDLPNYSFPCDRELFGFFSENLILIAGVGIGVGIVMISSLVLSMCLCCIVKRDQVRERYHKVQQKQPYNC